VIVSATSRSRKDDSANRKIFDRYAPTTESKTTPSGTTDDDGSMAAANSRGFRSIVACGKWRAVF
jgi:hypothetical protein